MGKEIINNTLIVFKEFKKAIDYDREKKIYHHLEKNIEQISEFVYLEGIEFDDKKKVIILPRCECSLSQYA